MDKTQGKELLEIKNIIVNQFGQSEWLELGFYLGCNDLVQNHPRLLRSLGFGDEDYEGNVLSVLDDIIKQKPENFKEIKIYLSDKYSSPQVSEYISTAHEEMPRKMITFSPQVFSIPSKPQNDKLVTVMLPFTQQAAFTSVKNACDNLGLECKKADDIWENSTFIQDIFELIFTSKVMVADFTGKNPNVFYEVGIAHTLGKTVIPIIQAINDIPSDLGHHRALLYLPNEQGYKELTEKIDKRLRTLFPDKELW
jgi:AbiJ N-terminal domain 5